MRNLVLCLDGTWNRADAAHPTNVVRTYRAAAATAATAGEERQLVYYDAGVGTGRWDRVRGGVFGVGLAENVDQAYRWLAQHYRPGDRIFLFGYSRGAYTARSVAGMLGGVGLPPEPDPEWTESRIRAYRSQYCGGSSPVPVHFLGVWDTVGSLGVPIDGLRWVGARRHRWHDVTLGPHIRTACHLVAIDEKRRPFAPSLWTAQPTDDQQVEQVWFPGVHSDVGGGGADNGLSDHALGFMWRRALAAGLRFAGGLTTRRWSDCRPADSMTAAYRLLGPYHRPIGTGVPGESIHQAAVELAQCSPSYLSSPSGRAVVAAIANGVEVAA
ncbi:MAG: DUF2235 domain-containing protein [Holophagales bacterium]|nr:DUF2235 domain-containing protein [Holophagales bacterium]MYH25466.1 DUF2235 domain-containing protein [Holophagales bacterium]